jgi:ornithine carbamoyltransferase
LAQNQADASLFMRAGSELGAHVSRIRSSLVAGSSAHDVQRTARLLGRLYDAVECHGLEGELVRRLAAEAGVPVYDGLASPGHATAALAEMLGAESSPADKRRFVVQAVLLVAVG